MRCLTGSAWGNGRSVSRFLASLWGAQSYSRCFGVSCIGPCRVGWAPFGFCEKGFWACAPAFKGFTIPVWIIAAIRQHLFGVWKITQSGLRIDVNAERPHGQEHSQGATNSARDGTEVRVHPIIRAPDQASSPLFCTRSPPGQQD
jgi:hypothetical protein